VQVRVCTPGRRAARAATLATAPVLDDTSQRLSPTAEIQENYHLRCVGLLPLSQGHPGIQALTYGTAVGLTRHYPTYMA
jgi:hypothetical protein